MRFSSWKYELLLIFAVTIVTAKVLADDLSPAELKQGKAIFVAKCAKCHTLPVPKDYNKAKWDQWMGKMAKKSHLTPQQSELVAKYTEFLRGSEADKK